MILEIPMNTSRISLIYILLLAMAFWVGCSDEGPMTPNNVAQQSVVGADQGGTEEAGAALLKNNNTVPFHAVIDNTFWAVPPFPPVNAILEGVGESNPFGPLDHNATGQLDIFVFPWVQTATGSFTYRDGSELHYNAVGTSIEDPPGTATFSGDFTFTGGTGRFTNATGGGTYAGTADLFAGVDHWTFEGVISGFGGQGGGKRDLRN
jgi:hypothetical protein